MRQASEGADVLRDGLAAESLFERSSCFRCRIESKEERISPPMVPEATYVIRSATMWPVRLLQTTPFHRQQSAPRHDDRP
jgi:hypothetical protein